jgi:predicted negative regulator of RcsB-dependent stress response
MEIYNSEEQQEEALKRFLKENGLVLVAGVVLGLGGIYGFNSYQANKITQMGADSMSYSAVAKSTDISVEAAKYVAEHSSTQYSQLAQLLSVKALVDANKLDEASALLQDVIASNVDSSVKSIATMRLARIENAQLKYAKALTTLATLTDDAFDVQKNELSGDIELAQGNVDKARLAYLAAETAAGEEVSNDLQMKLNDLTPAA